MVTNNDLSTIGGRIAKAIELSGKSQRQIALSIGITPQALNKWPKTGNASKEALFKFCELTGINYNWLLTGHGNMEKTIVQGSSANIEIKGHPGIVTHSVAEIAEKYGVQPDPNLFNPEPDKPDTTTFVDIPYYEGAELSMGNGAVIHDDEHPGRSLSFQQEWLDSLDLDPSHLVVVKCVGRSMEPRIFDQDVVLINRNIESIEDGAIYALNFAGQARLKRLITRSDGSLIIRSDNKDEFPDEIVEEHEADQIKIVGRAVWIGSTLI